MLFACWLNCAYFFYTLSLKNVTSERHNSHQVFPHVRHSHVVDLPYSGLHTELVLPVVLTALVIMAGVMQEQHT